MAGIVIRREELKAMQVIGFFPVLKWFSLKWADNYLEIQGKGENVGLIHVHIN